MLWNEFTRDRKVEKNDRLRFSPGTCLILEKRNNIVSQNA